MEFNTMEYSAMQNNIKCTAAHACQFFRKMIQSVVSCRLSAQFLPLCSSQGPQPLLWYTIQLGNLTTFAVLLVVAIYATVAAIFYFE